MKVVLVPSAFTLNGISADQHLTTFVVNETLAVDAGALGCFGSALDQARIRHVLISHTHIDHVATLPIFVENAYEGKRDCVTIHGSPYVLRSLREDVFNNRLWPDFFKLSTESAPFLKVSTLESGTTVCLDGLYVTPVTVDHVVPTQGFLIQDPESAVLFASDTGPTEEIWRYARETPNLKAVFLEACFPNEMEWLADVAKHLTPEMFAREVGKLDPSVRFIAVHLKSRFRVQVENELQALGLPQIELVKPGYIYEF